MNGDNILSLQACLSVVFDKVRGSISFSSCRKPAEGVLLKLCQDMFIQSLYWVPVHAVAEQGRLVLPSPLAVCFCHLHGWHKYGCNQTSCLSKSWKLTWPGAEKWVVPAGAAPWVSSHHLFHASASPKQSLPFRALIDSHLVLFLDYSISDTAQILNFGVSSCWFISVCMATITQCFCRVGMKAPNNRFLNHILRSYITWQSVAFTFTQM